MRASAISLVNLTFLEISAKTDVSFQGKANDYDFTGTLVHCAPKHGKQSEDGLQWWVALSFGTKSEESKRCPYTIDIKAVGSFRVEAEIPEDKREKFIFESGASLVYGAIREMVSTITARSAHGTLMLPTASFFGEFEDYQKKQAELSEVPTPIV
jgi:preprotein translocase subunit SecB